jgi:hypothetical protein
MSITQLASWLFLTVCVVAGDHAFGPLFPDDWYCKLGAGEVITQPGRLQAEGYRADSNCGAYKAECATGWVQYPASAYCAHKTLWTAIRNKVLKPPSSSSEGVDPADTKRLRREMFAGSTNKGMKS